MFQRNFDFLFSKNRVGDDIKTVDDLLARDDVNNILNEVDKSKKDIQKLIVIWEDGSGALDWRTSNMRMSKLIGMLEMIKMYVMMDNEYCTEDNEDD